MNCQGGSTGKPNRGTPSLAPYSGAQEEAILLPIKDQGDPTWGSPGVKTLEAVTTGQTTTKMGVRTGRLHWGGA